MIADSEQAPLNYFEAQMLFGDLRYEGGLATLERFTAEVLPAMRAAANDRAPVSS